MDRRLDEPKDNARTQTDAEREAALGAWTRGELQVSPQAAPSRADLRRMLADAPVDEDGYVAPPKRAVFPPSFLAVIAACLGMLAIEPTADLSWHLFGPSAAVELGEPGQYRFDALADGLWVRLEGIASPRRGNYSRWGDQWEVYALVGTPLLVRARPGTQVEANTAELVSVQGRLLRLDTSASGFVERLLRPAARYTSLKLTFEALGELPADRATYLVLDGDVPRSSLFALASPLVLWGLCLLVAVTAVRSTLRRRAALARPPRSP